jgi:arylsulfotransferase ASST
VKRLLTGVVIVALACTTFSAPSVYPTGTTIYRPDKTWSGYTVFDTPNEQGAVLIDMNGTLLRRWKEVAAVPGPARLLPGGDLIGGSTRRRPHQEARALLQISWKGETVWKFDRADLVEEAGTSTWMARQHHDWQREGSPTGDYAPDALPMTIGGKTLILTHKNVTRPEISDKLLEDDRLIEVSWDGKIVWDWLASDHVDSFGFTEQARNAIHRSPAWTDNRGSGDWLHVNAAAYLGSNKWYDAGDRRFHPDNIIISSRNASIIAIIDRTTGGFVWRMGPDYRESSALRALGQIVGQHHPHLIPKGLPGAGNLLIFDNGGASVYDDGNAVAPTGANVVARINSRVLEINPVTFEKVWEYSISGQERFLFASHYVSSAQRLPNGNTLVDEGADGRLFEVTPAKEIVWEYVNPYFAVEDGSNTNRVFRAQRVPYDWVPQLPRPVERAVIPPDITTFRIEPRDQPPK